MKNVTPQRSRRVRGEEFVSPRYDESESERVEEREEVEEFEIRGLSLGIVRNNCRSGCYR